MADPTRPEPTPRDVEVAREITAKLQRCYKAAAALGQHPGCAEEWEEYTRATVARYREEIEAPLRGDVADWKESAHAKDEIVAEVEAVAARNLVLTEERDYARQSEERLREALRVERDVAWKIAGMIHRGEMLNDTRGGAAYRGVVAHAERMDALLAPAGGPDSAPPAAERGTEQRWCRYCTQGIPLEQDANGLFHRGANYSGTRERRLFCTAQPPAPVQPANSSGSGANLNNRAGSASKLNDPAPVPVETRHPLVNPRRDAATGRMVCDNCPPAPVQPAERAETREEKTKFVGCEMCEGDDHCTCPHKQCPCRDCRVEKVGG